MRRLVPVLFTVSWCACSPPSSGELPDAVRELYRSAGPDAAVRLIVVPASGADREGLARLDGTRPLRHVPVAIADWTAGDAERALERFPGLTLLPDQPLLGAGGPQGVQVTADPDVVRRSVGADLVHAGAGVPRATGRGVTIAVVDSGIDERHKDLPRGVLLDAADFVDLDEAGDEGEAREDGYGHGTMVAGVLVGTRDGVRGIAPDARLVSARVLDEDGVGTVASAVAATDWVIEHADETGVDLLHYSIGAAPVGSFTVDPMALAAEAALEAGLVVVAAAGNYGASDGAEVWGGIVSPAVHPGVLAVGATDGRGTARRSDDRLASFSSRGPTAFDGLGKPDLVAPGTALVLTADEGGTLWDDHPSARVGSWPGVKIQKNAPYEVASGTSFAAPVVTGIAALMLEAAPDLSATGVRAALELTASDLGDATRLGSGAGLVNAAGAVRLASSWARGGPAPATSDVVAGETVPWGLTILWDGYVFDEEADLSALTGGDLLAVGDLSGTGILWEGYGTQLRYLGVVASGTGLVAPDAELATTGAIWGTGILWDGSVQVASGRVWTHDARWSGSFVAPTRLDTAGLALPLFELPSFSGLTEPDRAAPDPLPVRPDFDSPR